jgi:hypothetical protein
MRLILRVILRPSYKMRIKAIGIVYFNFVTQYRKHPNIMPSRFINRLKTVSSRLIRKEFSSHHETDYWKPVL